MYHVILNWNPSEIITLFKQERLNDIENGVISLRKYAVSIAKINGHGYCRVTQLKNTSGS